MLYRWALAREGSTLKTDNDSSTLSQQKQTKLLIQALDDLQRCLDILDGTKDPIMKTAGQNALDRLEKSYNTLLLSTDEKEEEQEPPSKQPQNGSASSMTAPP